MIRMNLGDWSPGEQARDPWDAYHDASRVYPDPLDNDLLRPSVRRALDGAQGGPTPPPAQGSVERPTPHKATP